jgi:hypothetical protein
LWFILYWQLQEIQKQQRLIAAMKAEMDLLQDCVDEKELAIQALGKQTIPPVCASFVHFLKTLQILAPCISF